MKTRTLNKITLILSGGLIVGAMYNVTLGQSLIAAQAAAVGALALWWAWRNL